MHLDLPGNHEHCASGSHQKVSSQPWARKEHRPRQEHNHRNKANHATSQLRNRELHQH